MNRKEGESIYDWIDRKDKIDKEKEKIKDIKPIYYYKSIGGVKVNCYIIKKIGWFKVMVFNENGANVILKRWHLNKIKNKGFI